MAMSMKADTVGELIKLPESLITPRTVKASDFPQPATWGEATGKDTLTPTVWDAASAEGPSNEPMSTNRSSAVAASFPVGQSTAGAGTSVSIPSTVSLSTGLISPEPTGWRPKAPDVTKAHVNQRSN